jgi:hypothetical protein
MATVLLGDRENVTDVKTCFREGAAGPALSLCCAGPA